ncbi:MAG: hypothetical protein SGPRY_007695 [Prymnesium sp.]
MEDHVERTGVNFNQVVGAGLARGLTRAAAEQRARDICFGDGERVEEDASEPVAGEKGVQVFSSVEELWGGLQQAWERRGQGVELTEVLEHINQLLERGIISGDDFVELLARSKAHSTRPASKAEAVRQGSEAPDLPLAASAVQCEQAALHSRHLAATLCLQSAFRAKRGRELFEEKVQQRARVLRAEQKLREEAEQRRIQQQSSAIQLQAALRRRAAVRSLRRAQRAAAALQATARRRHQKKVLCVRCSLDLVCERGALRQDECRLLVGECLSGSASKRGGVQPYVSKLSCARGSLDARCWQGVMQPL